MEPFGIYRHKQSRQLWQCTARDEANRRCTIRSPAGTVEMILIRDLEQDYELIDSRVAGPLWTKALLDAAFVRPLESPPGPDTDRLARIEANQRAIIEALNRLGRHLKMDWQEIEAAGGQGA